MGEKRSEKEKVNINSRDVVQKGSEGETLEFPDVCETPSPVGQIPIPYPNIDQSSDASKGTKTVKTNGKEAMVKGVAFKKSAGDEPSHTPDIDQVDTEKIPEEPTLRRLLNIRKLSVPIWLWGLIGIGGLLIIWLLSSNVGPQIEPYDVPMN